MKLWKIEFSSTSKMKGIEHLISQVFSSCNFLWFYEFSGDWFHQKWLGESIKEKRIVQKGTLVNLRATLLLLLLQLWKEIYNWIWGCVLSQILNFRFTDATFVEASESCGKVIKKGILTSAPSRFIFGVRNDGYGHVGRMRGKNTWRGCGKRALSHLSVANRVALIIYSYHEAKITSPNQDCKISIPHFTLIAHNKILILRYIILLKFHI